MCLTAPPASAATCLSYANRVELSGTLERRTFAGPPQFESIALGDAPETIWLLKLDTPACVSADPKDESGINAAVGRFSEIQLLVSEAQYRLYARWIGTQVILKGRLQGRMTQHHRTPVLLEQIEFGH